MIENSPLGKSSKYINTYTPSLLYPIQRQLARRKIGISEKSLPFGGVDIWNGYELSWLNNSGKPEIGIAEFIFPCDSEFLIESKSFKLYLNSFNQSKFSTVSEVHQLLVSDLSKYIGSKVEVNVFPLETYTEVFHPVRNWVCIDNLDIATDCYQTNPVFLQYANTEEVVREQLCSHLLKSNCLATGQPDWGTVFISYEGKPISHEGLLKYIVSFRNHSGFHEDCVEQMFCDIRKYCRPSKLSVYARYTRRGGLDINPFRSNFEEQPLNRRLFRQ